MGPDRVISLQVGTMVMSKTLVIIPRLVWTRHPLTLRKASGVLLFLKLADLLPDGTFQGLLLRLNNGMPHSRLHLLPSHLTTSPVGLTLGFQLRAVSCIKGATFPSHLYPRDNQGFIRESLRRHGCDQRQGIACPTSTKSTHKTRLPIRLLREEQRYTYTSSGEEDDNEFRQK